MPAPVPRIRLARNGGLGSWGSRPASCRKLTAVTPAGARSTTSARFGADLRANLGRPPLAAMPVEYLTPAVEDRAVEVLTLLADRGQHRAPSIPDLLIAAAAELAGLTILHMNKDFEVIAAITGQPLERLDIA